MPLNTPGRTTGGLCRALRLFGAVLWVFFCFFCFLPPTPPPPRPLVFCFISTSGRGGEYKRQIKKKGGGGGVRKAEAVTHFSFKIND